MTAVNVLIYIYIRMIPKDWCETFIKICFTFIYIYYCIAKCMDVTINFKFGAKFVTTNEVSIFFSV